MFIFERLISFRIFLFGDTHSLLFNVAYKGKTVQSNSCFVFIGAYWFCMVL